jgi:dihydroneopterin aldolase
MRDSRGLTVAKLGGSHALSPHLSRWLDALVCGAGHVVLVPGGGPFADTVRAAQLRMGFDDAAAHHMALLAMEQYGRALVSLNAGLLLASSVAAIHRALRDRKVPVWSPTTMVLRANIPCSWDVTADSLAVWLAGRIGARRVLLIKHVEPRGDPVPARQLVEHGIVDPAFSTFLKASRANASIVGPRKHAAAAAALARGATVGSRIDLR